VTGNLLYMAADKLMENNQSILNSANALITDGTIENNIFYTGQEKSYMAIYGGKDKWFEGVKEITKLESDPFTSGKFDIANGVFTPSAEYASYSASTAASVGGEFRFLHPISTARSTSATTKGIRHFFIGFPP
jgi:hypothetical protein